MQLRAAAGGKAARPQWQRRPQQAQQPAGRPRQQGQQARQAQQPQQARRLPPQQGQQRQPAAVPPGDLACPHFSSCSGCVLDTALDAPPVAAEAAAFFAARGAPFALAPARVSGWRCRAKLAVRGRPGAPRIGLFAAGSHDVTAVPECAAHHPRINAAVQLVQQVAAGLRIAPYCEGSSSASSSARGHLRYLQLTALPSSPGGRAETDAAAQVQLVLVWAAPDGSHPSVADARRLAAALWRQAGPQQAGAVSGLAALRARAEAAAAARAGSGSESGGLLPLHSVGRAAAAPTAPGTAVVLRRGMQQQPATAAGGSASSSDPAAQPPLLHSIYLNFQPEASNAILGATWLRLHGPEWGWAALGGVQLAIGPGSFVQANFGAMSQALASIAAAVPAGSRVLELYAGSGLIGLALAAAGAARSVVCVEVVPAAAAAFEATRQRLAASNKAAAAAVRHVTASAGDAAVLAQLLVADRPDVLVVDPPRRGLDAALLELLTGRAGVAGGAGPAHPSASDGDGGGSSSTHLPARLVYLSCGWPALQRDADALLAGGWRLASAEGLVFFPGSDALETLAVFERRAS